MKGFGNDGSDSSTGISLKAKKQNPIHQFLLKKFNEPELLKGLYKIAHGERYLLKKEALAELAYLNILKDDGTMPSDVASIVRDSIIIEEDGEVVLEMNQ